MVTLNDIFDYFRADELASRSAPDNRDVTGDTLLSALNEPDSAPVGDQKALNRIQLALDDAHSEVLVLSGFVDFDNVNDDYIPLIRRIIADFTRGNLYTESMPKSMSDTIEINRGLLSELKYHQLVTLTLKRR